MVALIWRGWAALSLLAGTIVAPLFLEVFAGGSVLRFLALPLRYAWATVLCRPILREGWLRPRAVAVGLAAFTVTLSGVTLLDLSGRLSTHPGWFLTLEWWQRPVYPWLELLPRWSILNRPGYLWTVSLWNLAEGLAAATILARWRSPYPVSAVAPAGSRP